MDTTYSTYSSTDGMSSSYSTSSTADAAGAGIAMLVMMPIYLAIMAVSIVSMWKLFTKAGKPGWASLVPVYNLVVMVEIVGRPLWWVAMFFIPVANIVFGVMLYLDLAKAYGKDSGWGILLILFPIVMMPIMAFSKNIRYVGPVASPVGAPVPPVATPPQQTPFQ